MAFSALQKIKIRTYLGYPSRNFPINDAIENALTACGDGSDLQSEIEALLTNIASADAQLLSALPMVGLKSVDKQDVVWQDSKSEHPAIAATRDIGRTFTGRLSSTLALPKAADYFGTAGAQHTIDYQKLQRTGEL